MDDTAKYLIHADITADGVVERSDVVGAIFGQTEGLLGDDLDLRDLQQSSKVGRIDVSVDSENGQSFGHVTIASSLDKVETAILAAALETIQRVGPCRASVSVASIEDVRAAKRREVVDRAKELLSSSFDDSVMTSDEILEEVRRSVRVEDITEYEGLPAGPNVVDSDAVIVVEGRADVLTLLRYGVKNGVAVEGTNVPDSVAELTQERTTTVFLDADRGGDLIRKELEQVADVDYVAVAPSGKSVEDLSRDEVMTALRNKRPFESFVEGETATATDGSVLPAPERDPSDSDTDPSVDGEDVATDADAATDADGTVATDGASASGPAESETTASPAGSGASASTSPADAETPAVASTATEDEPSTGTDEDASDEADDDTTSDGESEADSAPETLRGHVDAVVGGERGTTRLLDAAFSVVDEVPAEEAFDAVESAAETPHAVVVDGTVGQRLLDVAAQRGVDHVVAREEGEFVKKPTSVRVLTADGI
ncbi:DNA primase DnaG [Halomicrococcus sp. NG-SE-24]|uniref:DNA primase DnaG n=1 Tax=Halomicrococcus sp. NG-SE-24 TaxID=3436928 RepID=UPI003D98DDBB